MLRLLIQLAPCLVLISGSGCALFTSFFGEKPDEIDSPFTQTVNSPTAPTRDIIELDVNFAERPLGDPLLESILWENLDEIGPFEPGRRKSLNQAGIRIGVAGSNPPKALEWLLVRSSSRQGDGRSGSAPARYSIPIVAGADSFVQAGPAYESATIRIPTEDGFEEREFKNLRCVFRVTPQMEDGWVRLHFLPEIHYGSSRLRHTATVADWKLQSRQKVFPLYAQSFEVGLNSGEIAVLSSMGKDTSSIGRHFFVGSDLDNQSQRILVLKLARIKTVEGVVSE
ncbi:MAG: hypothetical protein O3A00_00505 [Planctomycetota bacterium]|nr:hypothetical protein [Planctomycetota bacterium]